MIYLEDYRSNCASTLLTMWCLAGPIICKNPRSTIYRGAMDREVVAAGRGRGRGRGVGRGGRPRRGFRVPDVRELLGLVKKVHPGKRQQKASGNLNLPENMTREEIEEYFYGYLRSNGIPREECNTVFNMPQQIRDQEDEVVLECNLDSADIYWMWAGTRREFFWLSLKALKDKSPQVVGDMKSIHNEITNLKEELRLNFEAIKARGGVSYGIPDQLMTKMEIPQPEKSNITRRRR